MSRLIVANWKMHFSPAEAEAYTHKLNEMVSPASGTEVVICPPFIDIASVSNGLDKQKFKLGAQNIHQADEGAYTGEVSGAMLAGMVDYVILGHSERRTYFHEDDKVISAKIAAALRHGIKPILCVGENLVQFQHNLGRKVVVDQLEADLAMITAEEIGSLSIAYEPIWAIGTGNFAKPANVQPVVDAIRDCITQLYGRAATDLVKVLYGGSVEADNAGAYLALPGVDGLLVGGASLNAHKFSEIVSAAG